MSTSLNKSWADAVEALSAGSMVVVPTDTVYGIAVRVHDRDALCRLFDMKGRDRSKPIAVLVASSAAAEELGVFDERSRCLAASFWPGAMTIVVNRQTSFVHDLGGARHTIGLRCPNHPEMLELLAQTGPLAVTSANLSGEVTPHTIAGVAGRLGEQISVFIDGGTLGGSASTVVDCTTDFPDVLREGPISRADLRAALAALA